ncbi:hypothetical protein OSTOST_04096 [Ostertagia ostertagi]
MDDRVFSSQSSPKVPGFNCTNVDQTKRRDNQQEAINRAVMSKMLKVLFVPNPTKMPIQKIVDFFLKEVKMRSTEMAIKLGWTYEDWHGTQIDMLMSDAEREAYHDGRIKWGSLPIDSLLNKECTSIKDSEPNMQDVHSNRKREATRSEETTVKQPRCENVDEEATPTENVEGDNVDEMNG